MESNRRFFPRTGILPNKRMISVQATEVISLAMKDHLGCHHPSSCT